MPKTRRAPITKGLLGAAGGLVGGMFGMSGLGKAAGDLLGRITGLGAYSVNSNTLLSNAVPKFSQVNEGMDISHREYIADVNSTTAFSNTAYPINPGVSTTFPWLSQIASSFAQYKFLGIVFEFKSTSGVSIGSTNTALGVIILSTNYNAADPLFANKTSMEQFEYTVSSVPSSTVLHPVECSPKLNVLSELYVRGNTFPTGQDQRLFDLGLFQIATQGSQATCDVGELWVTYHVRLFKPKFIMSSFSNTMYGRVVSYPIGTASATNQFGSGGGFVIGGLPLQSSTYGSYNPINSIVLPYVGHYLILIVCGSNCTANNNVTFGSNINGDTGAMTSISYGLPMVASGYGIILSFLNVSTAGSGANNIVTLPTLTGLSSGNIDCLVLYSGSSVL